ncbi:MAG: hypothetical protein BRD37_07045 [Bacteroidetes bacterium QH_8_67_23]|jgi:hypothetical protein|nr:MAG: hypothetical protein BRD37_07045 [Bacteroidetes bacterium QH_8_67_23]
MSTPSVDDENAGAALPPMALLATLQTATTVWEGVRERREGRDPAAQEAAGDARAYLDDAAGELTRLHMQLLMAKVQADRASEGNTADRPSDDGSDDEPAPPVSSASRLTAAVRRFDLLMKLRRTDRLLHGAHQRLMSLYPDVSEELVEEARQCRRELSDLRDASTGDRPAETSFEEALALFLQRLLGFAAWTQREV